MSDNLDEMLKKRVVPEVSHDLAERIIARAQVPSQPQSQPQQSVMVFQWFRPAYMAAFAVVLLVAAGMFVNGADIAGALDTPDAAMDDIAMYMVYESLEISAEFVL